MFSKTAVIPAAAPLSPEAYRNMPELTGRPTKPEQNMTARHNPGTDAAVNKKEHIILAAAGPGLFVIVSRETGCVVLKGTPAYRSCTLKIIDNSGIVPEIKARRILSIRPLFSSRGPGAESPRPMMRSGAAPLSYIMSSTASTSGSSLSPARNPERCSLRFAATSPQISTIPAVHPSRFRYAPTAKLRPFPHSQI